MIAFLVWLGIYTLACLAFNTYMFLGALKKLRKLFAKGGGEYAG